MNADGQLIPQDEAARLAAVRRYDILDTPPDGVFDRITALAARAFDVPYSVISVVDTDRIWFKSQQGLGELTELDRVPGLCASAILGHEPWVITDGATDPRTLANPLVAGEFGLRFYAGVPLRTRDGHNLGTLCVLGHEPRQVSSHESTLLEDLAELVIDQLELRLEARDRVLSEERLRREAEQLAGALQASLLPPTPPVIPGMEVATRFVPGEHGLTIGGDFLDVFRLDANSWALVVGDVCGKGAGAAALTGLARWTIRGAAVHQGAPSSVLRDLNSVLLADGEGDDHFCTAVFGRLELDAGGARVTLAISGHPQPILLSAAGLAERRGAPSLPLGMFPEVEPQDDLVELGPGDALVFYTDGIIESRDRIGDLFGTQRLIDTLTGCADCTADQIAQQLIDRARAFAAHDLTDDAAVLVVRVPVKGH